MFITKKHLSRRTLAARRGCDDGAAAARFHGPRADPVAEDRREAVAPPGLRVHPARRDHGQMDARYRRRRALNSRRILKPLEPFRDHVNVVSGLGHRAADSTAVHSLSPTTWLSGVRPKPTQGVDAYAGVTADQIAAQHIGQDTMLPSLELATEDHSGLIGACDRDYGCIYMNTLSWRTHTTPQPMEINPRKVFERMFGQGGSAADRVAHSPGRAQYSGRHHRAGLRFAAHSGCAGPLGDERLSGERARNRAAHSEERAERLTGARRWTCPRLRRASPTISSSTST